MKSDSSGVAPLKKGVSYSEAQDKAEILNDQFSSEYTTEDMSSIPGIVPSVPPLSICEAVVRKILEGPRSRFHLRQISEDNGILLLQQ